MIGAAPTAYTGLQRYPQACIPIEYTGSFYGHHDLTSHPMTNPWTADRRLKCLPGAIAF